MLYSLHKNILNLPNTKKIILKWQLLQYNQKLSFLMKLLKTKYTLCHLMTKLELTFTTTWYYICVKVYMRSAENFWPDEEALPQNSNVWLLGQILVTRSDWKFFQYPSCMYMYVWRIKIKPQNLINKQNTWGILLIFQYLFASSSEHYKNDLLYLFNNYWDLNWIK